MNPMKNLDVIARKLLQRNEVAAAVARWRLTEKRIVFTNGCFDLMHLGHIDYLSKAADLGDILIVGLNSDASTSALKGPHRPINNEESRKHIMASLFFVDAVVLFDEPTTEALIREVQPDVLVKGGDYKAENVVGYDVVTARGGRVEIIDFVPGYSTSLLEKKVLDASR